MSQRKAYLIQAGDINTIYAGQSEYDALQNYAHDAGYQSYPHLVRNVGEVDTIDEIDIKAVEREFDRAEASSDIWEKDSLESKYGLDINGVKDIVYECNRSD